MLVEVNLTDDRKIQRLIEKLTILLKSAIVYKDLEAHREDGIVIRWFGNEYILSGWDGELFRKAIQDLPEMYPQNSKDTIEGWFVGEIISLLVEHAVDGEGNFSPVCNNSLLVEQQAIKIHETLTSLIRRHTIFIPLEGVEFQVDKLQLGDVTLYPNTGGQLVNLLSEPKFYASYQHRKTELLEGGCYLALDIEGDNNLASAYAFQRVQDVIDILNLYLGSCRYREEEDDNIWKSIEDRKRISRKQKIGIWGTSSNSDQVFYSVTYEPSFRDPEINIRLHFNLRQSSFETDAIFYEMLEPLNKEFNVNRHWLHQIDESKIQELEQSGLNTIVAAFTSKSKINIRVKRAVTWYSKAVNADSNSEQFIALAIALESLLVGGGEAIDPRVSWGSITQKLADRVAFLLGDSYSSRIEFVKNTKRLYRIRSKVVHEGESVAKEDLYLFELIVKDSILSFVKHQFVSWDYFLEWINKQKYTVQ